MNERPTIGESLRQKGFSRRDFIKYCARLGALLALPPSMVPACGRTRRRSALYRCR
ncbi:MAG: twin-arginine translocation signal domain-containing protein [Rhodocyclaceae bacterium]|nr:MAG: twin-arginine translocation signal domain-containing protein [Rhodocyclaceae bacterium]